MPFLTEDQKQMSIISKERFEPFPFTDVGTDQKSEQMQLEGNLLFLKSASDCCTWKRGKSSRH